MSDKLVSSELAHREADCLSTITGSRVKLVAVVKAVVNFTRQAVLASLGVSHQG